MFYDVSGVFKTMTLQPNEHKFEWKKILLTAIPDKMFELIKKSNVVKYLKTCKEINIAFIPYEEQVIYFLFLLFLLFGVFC